MYGRQLPRWIPSGCETESVTLVGLRSGRPVSEMEDYAKRLLHIQSILLSLMLYLHNIYIILYIYKILFLNYTPISYKPTVGGVGSGGEAKDEYNTLRILSS